jgi:TFIIF-interacting CTD phosphatase-like protein
MSHPAIYSTPCHREIRTKCSKEQKTLVLDLDETLVHSSFEIVENPDYVIPVRYLLGGD